MPSRWVKKRWRLRGGRKEASRTSAACSSDVHPSAAISDRLAASMEPPRCTSRVADAPVDDYYAGAWTSLTTATLNGDLASACTKIFRHGCPGRI